MNRSWRFGMAALALWLGLTPAARADVHDSLPDLLSAWVAIQEDPSPPWELAWLRYEAVQSSWLDPTLYAGRTPVQKSNQIDATLHESLANFPDQMTRLEAFENGWGGDLATVNEGLRREFGKVPLVELYVAFSMSPAKLALGELGGKPSMCINARRLLPYRSPAMRVLLARYLFEWVMTRWPRSGPSLVGDRLHQEGMGIWAAGRVLPGVEDFTLLDVTPAQLRQLEAGRTHYAQLVLAGLDAKDPGVGRRLFAAEAPAGTPPAAGGYIGLLVARSIAQDLGQAKLPGLSHQEYLGLARKVLTRMAATAP